jgi:hypothetical protein
MYQGPTELVAGLVELVFNNNSEGFAYVNFLALLDDKTIEDVIEYIGEEPSNNHHPSWSRELGTWRPIPAGGSQRWTRNLDPGNYFMVCAMLNPTAVWLGTGLTVEGG